MIRRANSRFRDAAEVWLAKIAERREASTSERPHYDTSSRRSVRSIVAEPRGLTPEERRRLLVDWMDVTLEGRTVRAEVGLRWMAPHT